MAVPSATTLMASARSRSAQDDPSPSWTADSRGLNGRSTSKFAEPRSVKSADAEAQRVDVALAGGAPALVKAPMTGARGRRTRQQLA
jgi:hypothetical protein